MLTRMNLISAVTTLVIVLGLVDSSQAQSRIYGTLRPIRFSGPCQFNLTFQTDSAVSRASVIWGLKDKKDTLATRYGLNLAASGSSFPSRFTSNPELIPNTLLYYMSGYSFSRWDKRRKTITMVKESWVFSGWGSQTTLHCYGAWGAEVNYK
jgi:hypothetical protein